MSAATKAPDEEEWPAHFPKGCPPADALPLNGKVWMLVRSNPATVSDSECAIDKGLHADQPPCLRASLSCGLTKEHVRELRAGIPSFKKRLIAVAELDEKHGRIKQTFKPGHHSMWLRRKSLAMLPTLFKVDEP